MVYKHKTTTMYYFNYNLDGMNQASMKYKLGKLTRVPLDTLSFANYHKTLRTEVLLKYSEPNYIDNYSSYSRQGWSDSFLDKNDFNYDYEHEEESLASLINYIFKTTVSRETTAEELAMFKNHMLADNNGKKILLSPYFDMFDSNGNISAYKRKLIALIVLDYISRLDDTYMQKEVN